MISPTSAAASSSGISLRRWRRIAASITQISSSAWHGFVIQASAPSRSPRTRCATEDGPVQTITARPGSRAQTRSRYSQLPGPSTARSTTSAFSRIATSASAVTALETRAVIPPERVEPVREHLHESGIAVDDRQPEPVARALRGCLCRAQRLAPFRRHGADCSGPVRLDAVTVTGCLHAKSDYLDRPSGRFRSVRWRPRSRSTCERP